MVVHTRYDHVGTRLYAGINGVETAGTNAANISAGGGVIKVGKASAVSPNFFNGRIAELAMKQSAALPVAFITALMALYGIA